MNCCVLRYSTDFFDEKHYVVVSDDAYYVAVRGLERLCFFSLVLHTPPSLGLLVVVRCATFTSAITRTRGLERESCMICRFVIFRLTFGKSGSSCGRIVSVVASVCCNKLDINFQAVM